MRDNVLNGDHGSFLMNANASRFNFTMKGPELWGGKVTGFLEMDFDGGDTINQARAVNGVIASWQATNDSSFNQAKLRLRHAMFKIAWSEQEVLFGQYWSVNSELIPETADSGGYASMAPPSCVSRRSVTPRSSVTASTLLWPFVRRKTAAGV